MGCWNKTCGLSNLHIYAGDEVYVFVLSENTDKTDRCYSTAFWSPLLLPFYSQYNDYGGGENSHGAAFQTIMNAVAENLIEMDVGENQYHDIAVKREGFGEEQFFEAVHENRLFTKGWRGAQCAVDFVMFRKDIVDYILDNRVIESYVGDGKGTGGYRNNYIHYKFQDILTDIPEFINKIQDMGKTSSLKSVLDELKLDPVSNAKKIEELEDLIFDMSIQRGFENVFEWRHPNKVSQWVRGDGYRYSSIIRISELVTKLVRTGQIEEATQILTDHLKAQFIDGFMSATRHNWGPAGHEGSQSAEVDDYRVLLSAITNALDKEKQEWEEENEE